MKIRIKFRKWGVMKFIGHLDMMRYFQKAVRRAKIDIRYSEGYSPHQIMSFAAPLGVGITSDGEYFDIEGNLQQFGSWIASKVYHGKDDSFAAQLARGFISATLIFCIGAMAVVGALQDGLKQDPTILYAKATLDGIISVILTANLGIGVAFSAFSVFIYQGCLTLLAAFLQTVMTEAVLNEITACGGVLITAIGINMLKILEIRISNQLPAIFIAWLLAYIFI